MKRDFRMLDRDAAWRDMSLEAFHAMLPDHKRTFEAAVDFLYSFSLEEIPGCDCAGEQHGQHCRLFNLLDVAIGHAWKEVENGEDSSRAQHFTTACLKSAYALGAREAQPLPEELLEREPQKEARLPGVRGAGFLIPLPREKLLYASDDDLEEIAEQFARGLVDVLRAQRDTVARGDTQ